MDLPDYISLLEDGSTNLRKVAEPCVKYIGTYERSWPDNIHNTTEGRIRVRIEGNEHLSIKPQIVLVAFEDNVGELDRVTVLEADTVDDLLNKAEDVTLDELEHDLKKLYSGFIRPSRNQKPVHQRMKQEIRLGYQKPNCPECGAEVKAEPDATKTYCGNCEESVTVPGTL